MAGRTAERRRGGTVTARAVCSPAAYSFAVLRVCSCRATSAREPESDG